MKGGLPREPYMKGGLLCRRRCASSGNKKKGGRIDNSQGEAATDVATKRIEAIKERRGGKIKWIGLGLARLRTL